MISKITILVNYNLYESKRYFVSKFAEALERHGIQVTILDAKDPKNLKENVHMVSNPAYVDLTCSFNTLMPTPQGKFMWEYTSVPHWAILVDPSFYYRNLFNYPEQVLISCVDHFDCELARSFDFENVFFWAHAVERELSFVENRERPYDVVFLGSCYDHEFLKSYWRRENPPQISEAIEDAIDIVLGDNKTPLMIAINTVLANKKIDINTINLDKIIRYVDNYMRGKDRFELIRSIKDVEVHVFGGTCWREEQPVQGWSQNLAHYPNVVVHPAVTFEESLEILKQSKICLNSMPFFKNGTHERIFTGLSCGALPITTDNLWIRDNFIEGEEILLYQSGHWDEVNDKVHRYLSDEIKRKEIVQRGREKVMREHTWDVRVDQLLKEIPPLLEKMQQS